MGSLTRLREILHRDRRRRLLGPWVVANGAYDVLHTSVMIGIFHRYGLNPWIYIFYVIGFSVGFAWSSLAFVGALVDRQYRRAWPISAVVAVCFFAPELFLITTTQHVPRYVYVLFGAYLAGSSTLAVLTLARRYRANRLLKGADLALTGPTPVMTGTSTRSSRSGGFSSGALFRGRPVSSGGPGWSVRVRRRLR